MIDDIDNEQILGLEKSTDYVDTLPRGYLSVSQVAQYMKCGMAYYFRYVLEMPVPRNSFMAQGSAVHKAAEHMNLFLMENAIAPSLEYVEARYSDAHDEFFSDGDVVIAEEDVSVGHVKDVGILLTQLYYQGAKGELIDPDTKQRMGGVYPVGVERVVKQMLSPGEGERPIPFMAVIDLEEPNGVVDIKTKRKKGSQAEVDNSLQLSLYSHMTGKPDVRHDQLIKPGKTTPKGRYLRTSATRSPGENAHAIDIVAGVARDVSKGRFPLTMPDNWWCTVDWCPYWSVCRGKKR